jgi:hypothetical protein
VCWLVVVLASHAAWLVLVPAGIVAGYYSCWLVVLLVNTCADL